MESTDRRTFLKSSALAAGAASLPTIGLGQVAGSAVLKVAVVGCGGRGTGAAQQALNNPGVKVVALADADMDACRRCRDKLNGTAKGQGSSVEIPDENMFAGIDAYKKAIDLCDVLVTAAPPGFRPSHFEYAVAKGKHVFMEKPVATSAEGIRRVLAAAAEARKKNLKIVVGFQRHFDPVYVETRKRVLDGMAGEILAMQAYWMGGGLWIRDRKPGMSELQYQATNWFYFYHVGGDGIVEQHVHNIDACLWMSGLNVARAYGTGGREVRRGPRVGNIYDHFATEFELENGGIMTSFWRHHDGAQGRVSETLIGTKGTVTLGKIVGRDGSELWRYEGPKLNPYQEEHNVLFAAIRNNDEINMAEESARSCMAAILGRMACYSGGAIPLSRGLNAKDKILPDDATDWNTPVGIMPGPDGIYEAPIPGKYDALNPPGAIG
jgi:myo-inositol 2-dehydrogenase / D-chiro-inositol 1-dehydrogenase